VWCSETRAATTGPRVRAETSGPRYLAVERYTWSRRFEEFATLGGYGLGLVTHPEQFEVMHDLLLALNPLD
jgi:hypothetical protein